MKIIKIVVLVLSFQVVSYGQKYLGIPFLDKCKKSVKCEPCKTKNPEVLSYLDSLDKVLNATFLSKDSLKASAKKKLDILNREISTYKGYYDVYSEKISPEKEILARLLLSKIKLMVEELIDEKGIVYNLALSEYESYGSFEGVNEVNSLVDEIIALNISESTNQYCRELRLKYMVESYAFYDINPEDDSWFYDKKIKKLKNFPEDKIMAAETFINDSKSTSFVPFNSFSGVGLGVVGAFGRNWWIGYEISSDMVEYVNPFRLWHPISQQPHSKFSLISSSLLINTNNPNQQDLTFGIVHFKHPLVNVNLAQFGLHYGLASKGKWFYRPELGLSYGIFRASYSYNLTFDKSIRNQTEKHLFTFGISYPLIRFGDYY